MSKIRNEKKKAWYEDIKDRFDELNYRVARLEGILEEMRRHNSRTIRILAGIITVLLSIILALVSRIG